MKSWRTTIAGCAGAALLVLEQLLRQGVLEPKTLILAAAIAIIGALAKDFNVTSGSPGTPGPAGATGATGAQGPAGTGGFARLPMLAVLLLVCLALNACATVSGKTDTPQVTAGKSLLAIQQSIVATRDAIGVPCQQGVISQSDCQQMDDLYRQSKPMVDAAIDAEILALNGAPTDAAAYQQRLSDIVALEVKLITLAGKYAVQGGAN